MKARPLDVTNLVLLLTCMIGGISCSGGASAQPSAPAGVTSGSGHAGGAREVPGSSANAMRGGELAKAEAKPPPGLLERLQPSLPLLGVLIGSVIAFLTSLWFKAFERRAEYAVRNRREIYKPLYEETVALRRQLEEQPYLRGILLEGRFGAQLPRSHGSFQYWSKIQQDDRVLRTADDVRSAVERLVVTIRAYNAGVPVCIQWVERSCQEVFAARGRKTNVANLGEVCWRHALSGSEEMDRGFVETCFGKEATDEDSAAWTAASCAVRDGDEVTSLRRLSVELRDEVGALEQLLQSRMEWIMRRYEGRRRRI